MRLMIRCDMEGVTGVVHPAQVTPESPGYGFGLAMLHYDLAAVIQGLFSAGNHEIWIYDMHAYGRNLDLARLDGRVRVVSGKPHYQPGNLGGLTAGFDGQILLGLHCKAGSGELLAHSYEPQIRDILLNGVSVGEIGLEAALAGEFGVPTVLVTGDSAGCAEARALLGHLPTVAIKDSLGPTAGLCYPVEHTGALLREGARNAVTAVDYAFPYTVAPPITLTFYFEDGVFAAQLRNNLREFALDDGSIAITADSVAEAWARYLGAKL